MPFRLLWRNLGRKDVFSTKRATSTCTFVLGDSTSKAAIPGLTVCKKSSKGWNFYWYSKCSTTWNKWNPINQGFCGIWGPYQLVRWPAFLGQLEVGALSSNFSMVVNCQTSQPYRCQTRGSVWVKTSLYVTSLTANASHKTDLPQKDSLPTFIFQGRLEKAMLGSGRGSLALPKS